MVLLLAYPATQRFRRTADLGRDRHDSCLLRVVLAGGLIDHAHSVLEDFRGILGLHFHEPILPNNGASKKSGDTQMAMIWLPVKRDVCCRAFCVEVENSTCERALFVGGGLPHG